MVNVQHDVTLCWDRAEMHQWDNMGVDSNNTISTIDHILCVFGVWSWTKGFSKHLFPLPCSVIWGYTSHERLILWSKLSYGSSNHINTALPSHSDKVRSLSQRVRHNASVNPALLSLWELALVHLGEWDLMGLSSGWKQLICIM